MVADVDVELTADPWAVYFINILFEYFCGLVVVAFWVVKEVVPDILNEYMLSLLCGMRNCFFYDFDRAVPCLLVGGVFVDHCWYYQYGIATTHS